MDSDDKSELATVWKCVVCGHAVHARADVFACHQCGQTWATRNGVPVFFEPAYYWGEVEQRNARHLVARARDLGWQNAIAQQFADDREMLISLLDWQRTSWVSLIGLDESSRVLDIGSGYGAITHALARVAGEVYSLEAIPERVDFVNERLKQEHVKNVRVAQASALALPLLDGAFDLVVINGVLEWIGEWTSEGDPRELQISFLNSVRRLLKPRGHVVIGIENRFGLAMWRGAKDHSGLPYTSLLPRRVADILLDYVGRPAYRLAGKTSHGYRTYTYTQRGYRRLLRQSGFRNVAIYAAHPGYNQPYALIPSDRRLEIDHVWDEISAAGGGSTRITWRRRLRLLLTRANLLPPNEFVIVAHTDTAEEVPLTRWLRSSAPQIRGAITMSLRTGSFRAKNVITLTDSDARESSLLVKSSTAGPEGSTIVDRELEILRHMHARGAKSFAVPEVLGSTKVGKFHYFAESSASGQSIARHLFRLGHGQRVRFLEQFLPACATAAESIARSSVAKATEVRVRHDIGLKVDASSKSLARAADLTVAMFTEAKDRRWFQHGDFSAENIFIGEYGQLSVIDWADTLNCASPLFDAFSLVISLLPYLRRQGGSYTALRQDFADAFFGDGEVAALMTGYVRRVAQQLEIERSRINHHLIVFLYLRIQQYFERVPSIVTAHEPLLPSMCKVHAEWVDIAVERAGLTAQ